MGYLNLGSSVKFGPHGKRRKTKAFNKCKQPTFEFRTYTPNQSTYDRLLEEQKELYKSLETKYGDLSHMRRKEPQVYSGERKLLGIATMHKSNMVPVFADDKNYAKDLAKMRR